MSPELDLMESRIGLLASETLGRLAHSSEPILFDDGAPDGVIKAPTSVRVGIDLVIVTDIAGSIDRFGAKYLERLFTPHELGTCRTAGTDGQPVWSTESLAARFAAKEAVVKVLRPDGPRPDWKSIEIHRSEAGWCEVRLFGRAQVLAGEAGITELAVSLTHEGQMAAAVVVALCTTGRPAGPVDQNQGKV